MQHAIPFYNGSVYREFNSMRSLIKIRNATSKNRRVRRRKPTAAAATIQIWRSTVEACEVSLFCNINRVRFSEITPWNIDGIDHCAHSSEMISNRQKISYREWEETSTTFYGDMVSEIFYPYFTLKTRQIHLYDGFMLDMNPQCYTI